MTRRILLSGQAATDYLLVLTLVGLALSIGEDSPITQVVQALAGYYQRFTWAIAQP